MSTLGLPQDLVASHRNSCQKLNTRKSLKAARVKAFSVSMSVWEMMDPERQKFNLANHQLPYDLWLVLTLAQWSRHMRTLLREMTTWPDLLA